MNIGMIVYSDMVMLDLIGPQTVFSMMEANVHLIGKSRAAVSTELGIQISPTATYETAPPYLDVLFIPGGLKGTIAMLQDDVALGYLAEAGAHARIVASDCTGSLILAAAGLLKGYRATSHWYVRDLLPLMGAKLDPTRVVADRNRFTGGGVTAGIDLGLTIAAHLRGEEAARRIQLTLEYDPQPPFDSGSPQAAGEALSTDVRGRRAPLIEAARQACAAAAARLDLSA